MATSTNLPHWDMTVIYPGLASPEFAAGFQSVTDAIGGLTTLFDQEHIGKRDPQPLDDATVQTFERVIERYNAVLAEYRTLSAYISRIRLDRLTRRSGAGEIQRVAGA